MSLLDADWLPFRYQDGQLRYLSIEAILDPEVVDLALPREDFQGAAYQFLIGLLQTALAPTDIDDWLDGWAEPPGVEAFRARLSPLAPAFSLFDNSGNGPRFMQDLDALEDVKPSPVAGLLIDSPGANGIKLNTDHFVKRGRVEAICPDCAALALFTLQINAPSGGAGHRVGLRGGGPMTTLVIPDDQSASLWQRLWLNVVPGLGRTQGGHDGPVHADDASLFPWMGPTRTSETKGAIVVPEEMHPLHVYWAMPRRFRLIEEQRACTCDLCGRDSDSSVREVRTKNYGANYDGPWRHPLTPYRRDPKKPAEPPLSLKGQPSGIGYRHWSHLVLRDDTGSGALPALTVADYLKHKAHAVSQARKDGEALDPLARQARLWAFGFDMDNMKPRCWHGVQLPLLAVPVERQAVLRDWVVCFTELAREAASEIRHCLKEAWFNRPKDAKGDLSQLDAEFFDATQPAFFHALTELVEALKDDRCQHMPSPAAKAWHAALRREALGLFDARALSGGEMDKRLMRAVKARRTLVYWFGAGSRAKPVRKFFEKGDFLPNEALPEDGASLLEENPT